MLKCKLYILKSKSILNAKSPTKSSLFEGESPTYQIKCMEISVLVSLDYSIPFTATDEGQWLTSANTKWMSTVKIFYQTFLYVKEKRA